MAEQNDGAAAAGGCQACGEIFVDFHGGAKNAAKNVPCVDIKFKVRRLSDFDSKTGTFFCDTLLMLDWEDPSLARATNGEPDFSQHFWPKAEMLGVTPSGGEEPPWDTTKPKYKPVKEKGSNVVKEHRATITVNYRMVLFARCNFRKEIDVVLLSYPSPHPTHIPTPHFSPAHFFFLTFSSDRLGCVIRRVVCFGQHLPCSCVLPAHFFFLTFSSDRLGCVVVGHQTGCLFRGTSPVFLRSCCCHDESIILLQFLNPFLFLYHVPTKTPYPSTHTRARTHTHARTHPLFFSATPLLPTQVSTRSITRR